MGYKVLTSKKAVHYLPVVSEPINACMLLISLDRQTSPIYDVNYSGDCFQTKLKKLGMSNANSWYWKTWHVSLPSSSFSYMVSVSFLKSYTAL